MLDFQLVSYFTNFAVQNVNKTFVYITDLTSTLTSCFSLCISSVYFKTSVKKTPAIDPDKISEAIFLNS